MIDLDFSGQAESRRWVREGLIRRSAATLSEAAGNAREVVLKAHAICENETETETRPSP